jgi:hypothetical protein
VMAPPGREGPYPGGVQEPTVARRAGVGVGPQPAAGELPVANSSKIGQPWRGRGQAAITSRGHTPRSGWPGTVCPHPSEAGLRPVNMLATLTTAERVAITAADVWPRKSTLGWPVPGW